MSPEYRGKHNGYPIVDIPKKLFREGREPADLATDERYAVPAGEVNMGAMLRDVQEALPRRIAEAKRRIENSELRSESEHPSIGSFDRNPRKYFTDILGSTVLPEFTAQTPATLAIEDFFQMPGRTYRSNSGKIQNRGRRYYAALDRELPTVNDKILVLERDALDAIKVIPQIDRDQLTETEFLHYIGILDVLKNSTLTLFHTLTYPERSKDFIPPTADYESMRGVAWEIAQEATRLYYQTLLGLPYDQDLNISSWVDYIPGLTDYITQLDLSPIHAKIQELDHPMIIALAAHQALTHHPDTEMVVVLPSGGTQLGIATQMAFELERKAKGGNTEVPLMFIPFSIHSGKKAYGSVITIDQIAERARSEGISGKKVLLIEDNSNTGESITMVREGLLAAGAAEVRVVLAEVDPGRAALKHAGDKAPTTVTNYMHEDLQHASGMVPIIEADGVDMQMRKSVANRIANAHL